jgi:uncharacterized delta-60 repeat protein
MHPRVVFALPAALAALVVLVGSADAAEPARELPVGALDPGFASGGWLSEAFTPNPGGGEGRDATLQPDGKIVVLTTPVDDYLSRYLPDGTLDTTFGNGGSVALPTTARADYGALAVDSEGRIIVVGSEETTLWRAPTPPLLGLGRFRGTVYRFLADGSPDPSFGVGGKTTITVPPPEGLTPGSTTTSPGTILIDPNGSITVGGGFGAVCAWEEEGDVYHFWEVAGTFVSRLHSDGSPDTQFGGSGLVSTHGRCAHDEPNIPAEVFGTVAQTSPDSVLSVTAHPEDNTWRFRFYSSTGTLTEARATELEPLWPGITSSGLLELPDEVVVLQPSGELLIGASIYGKEVLRRFTSQGVPDLTFGTAGAVVVPMESAGVVPFGVLGDGRILVAGLASEGVGVMRYLVDGSVDESFGSLAQPGVIGRPGQAWAVPGFTTGTVVNKLLVVNGQPLVIGAAQVAPQRQDQTALVLFRADGHPPGYLGNAPPPGEGPFAPIPGTGNGSSEEPPPVLGPLDPPIYPPGTGGKTGSGGNGRGGQHGSRTVLDALTVFLKSQTRHTISRLLKTGDHPLIFDAPEPGILSLRWTRTTTQASRRTVKPIVVANGTRTFPAAGRGTLTLHLTAAGRELLNRTRTMRIVATANFSSHGDTAQAQWSTLILHRN